MLKSGAVRFALVPALVLTSAGQLLAQSVSLEFTNATGMDPIELLDGTTVGIDGNGNLTAACVLDGDVCDGVGSGPAGPVPATTLMRTNGTGTINTGATLALSWTVQPAAEVCLATSTPVVSGWNNTLVSASGGTANLTMSTAGAYALALKCYNANGVSNLSTLNVTVQGTSTPTQIPECTDPALVSTGRVQPTGFTGNLVPWSTAFFGATFPAGPSFLAPIGSFTLRATAPSTRGLAMATRYLTVPFTPAANTNYKLNWLEAQPITAAGYNPGRVAESVFVSISKCAGDLRGHSTSGGMDLNLCRAQSYSAQLFFGTKPTSQCKVEAGQQYFMTFAFTDTTGTGALPTTTTCNSGSYCEANFSVQALQ